MNNGDCIKADEVAGKIWFKLGGQLVLFPPINVSKRALLNKLLSKSKFIEIRAPKPYLERNRNMVDEGTELTAIPDTFEEKKRSGTWATIRYARKHHLPITYIWPDGSLTKEK